MQLRWNAIEIGAVGGILVVIGCDVVQRLPIGPKRASSRKPGAIKDGSNCRSTCISGKSNLPALVQPTLWKTAEARM
jgi:hypothetical protein